MASNHLLLLLLLHCSYSTAVSHFSFAGGQPGPSNRSDVSTGCDPCQSDENLLDLQTL